MGFVGNLVLFAAVKEFCKSTKNWQSYSYVGRHPFWLRCNVAASLQTNNTQICRIWQCAKI